MTHWAASEPAEQGRLSAAQISRWREQGYCLVHDLLPNELLRAVQRDAHEAFPAPDSEAAADMRNFGSSQRFVFPADSDAANAATLHPALLQAVADLLGVPVAEIRLTQSDVWPKYGRTATSANNYDNADQRIHCDYPNHMLTHPPRWHEPSAVEIIIYLSDVETCAGSTAVVPRQGDNDPAYPWPITQTPGVAGVPYINDRARGSLPG